MLPEPLRHPRAHADANQFDAVCRQLPACVNDLGRHVAHGRRERVERHRRDEHVVVVRGAIGHLHLAPLRIDARDVRAVADA